MPEGWILDIHPHVSEDGLMTIWLKQRNGKTVCVHDKWSPSIYVYGESKEELKQLLQIPKVTSYIADFGFEYKIVEIMDKSPKEVMRLTLKNASDMLKIANTIYDSTEYGRYQIYNADIDPAQIYMYEHDIFPLADVKADGSERIKWEMIDSIDAVDYAIPELTKLRLQIQHKKEDALVRERDPIQFVELTTDEDTIRIETDEKENLLQLVKSIREIDPDMIFTDNGDSFVVPNILLRARVNGLSEKMILGRTGQPNILHKKKGSTYFSYGRVLYKPRPARFLGRVHIDMANTFVYAESGLEGLMEVARTCIVPLDTTVRASIGRIMTSIEFYHAYRDGILIPWKPNLAERFKNALDLMIGDRGGFIFEPSIGVYDNVAEIDFSSLYPTLMFKKNISAETIGCDCCTDSRIRVPELNYNICEKRIGIIPKALEMILYKRRQYKEMKKSAGDEVARHVYDCRQNALKWVLVSCFGYLGFRNAKFGRIDANMAVCAFARKTLWDAVKLAEANAYEIVHGIVDSLWLKKHNASNEDYLELCSQIEKETNLKVSFEGMYKWIAFLPSKMYSGLPVINRYFGIFKNGEIKIRGIEARKRDTPEFIRKCQIQMLEVMSRHSNSIEVKRNLLQAVTVLIKHVQALKERKVPIEQLVVNRRLTKGSSDYKKDIIQAIVAKQLDKCGRKLYAGESISYVITDYYNKTSERRAIHTDLINGSVEYDVRKYLEMLLDSANTILNPFGITNPLQATLENRIENTAIDI